MGVDLVIGCFCATMTLHTEPCVCDLCFPLIVPHSLPTLSNLLT